LVKTEDFFGEKLGFLNFLWDFQSTIFLDKKERNRLVLLSGQGDYYDSFHLDEKRSIEEESLLNRR
jgi:hypothetical protein